MSIALETKMHATRDDTVIAAAGRGDMNNDTELDSVDHNRVMDARSGAIWDPRADLDDDGDSDADDADLFDLKQPSWSTREAGPLATVSQAFSDVDNRYAFQGVPSFVMDTAAAATAANAKLILGHHRERFTDRVIGAWNSKDPLYSNTDLLALHSFAPQKYFAVVRRKSRITYSGNLYRLMARSNEYRLFRSNAAKFTDPLGQYDEYCGSICSDPEVIAPGFIGSGSAFTMCCTDLPPGIAGPPYCTKASCFDPLTDYTTCPFRCVVEHENVRLADAQCSFHCKCPHVPPHPECHCSGEHWTYADHAASDCNAYSVHLNCLNSGQCADWNCESPYREYMTCMQATICGQHVTYADAQDTCGPFPGF